ncbi:MAG TPA: hypothetical protein VER04_11965 [Polyangiaceae bacterium]|nr:hypothetical protein [Polyangiaceae bacterium]
MKHARAWLCFLTLACLAWGCKGRSERVEASYSSATRPSYLPAPERAVQKVPVGIDAIPTEEEYEERAASDISSANLERKLSELEKEMAF